MLVLLANALTVAPFDLLPPQQALEHGWAMTLAATPEVSAAEIARIMRHESGGWTDARPGMRHWPRNPARFPRRRHFICGLLQATARTAAECVSWINSPLAAYRAGVAQLSAWHAWCRQIGRRGKRRYKCARSGFAKGVAAAREA